MQQLTHAVLAHIASSVTSIKIGEKGIAVRLGKSACYQFAPAFDTLETFRDCRRVMVQHVHAALPDADAVRIVDIIVPATPHIMDALCFASER